MKLRLNSINDDSTDRQRDSMKRTENWLNYVREIECHNEIIEYLLILTACCF